MKYYISYASDNNYVQHLTASVISLFRNNRSCEFHVYILSNEIEEYKIEQLKEIAREHGHIIEIIEINEKISNIKDKIAITGHLTISAYSRLFLASLVSESVEKILYLDCDTIINGDITPIWNYDIDKYYIAGVLDNINPDIKLKTKMELSDDYINSGVVLVNLKRWREDRMESKFLDFIASFDYQVPHHDQGVLNSVIREKFLLPLKYNVQTPVFLMSHKNLLHYFNLNSFYSKQEYDDSKTSSVIIHFTPFYTDKPWCEFCLHPLKELYTKSLEETMYSNVKLLENGYFTFVKRVRCVLFTKLQGLFLLLKRLNNRN